MAIGREDVRLFVMLVLVVATPLQLFLSGVLVGLPHPSALLVAALATGLVRSEQEGLLVAFGGGLLLDLFTGPPLGRQALTLLVATLPVFLKHTEFARLTVLAPVLAAVVATLIYWPVLGIIDSAHGLAVPWLPLFLRWTLPTLFFHALLAMPANYLVDRLAARRGPRLMARS